MKLQQLLFTWSALLGLAFMPVGDTRCRAADPPPPPGAAATVTIQAMPAAAVPVQAVPARAFAVPIQAAAPVAAPAAAAKPATVKPAAVRPASGGIVLRAAAVKLAPAQPAKKGTLTDALVNAITGNQDAEKQRLDAQNQQLRAMEAEYRPQFQQMLYTELAFLRRACKPDEKQFLEVAKASKAGLLAPLHEYVAAISMPRMGPGMQNNDPRASLQKLLVPLAESKLGAEKARLYRQECDKRTESRKHAVVSSLVAALDERLVLTAAQRDKLVLSLTPKYDNSWDQYCEMFAYNGQYLPAIPEQSILPVLDEKQKHVWQEISKLNGQVFFGGMIFRGAQFGEATEIQEIAHLVEEVKDDP
jgi:hypothetical protein